jgi:g-D-glutamyl-meso-diaminopimelate peptidase
MDKLTTPQIMDVGTVRGIIYALRGRYGFLDAMPIGQSVLGREIYGLIIGGGRERVLYAAAFHGQEWMTSLILLRLCEDICVAMQHDGRIADMDFRQALAGRSLIFVPQMNPDGVEIALHGTATAGNLTQFTKELGGDVSAQWQANARGVDINHNFNAGWEQLQELEQKNGISGPAARQWCGTTPESEPETRALTQLCRRAQFRHAVALHSQGEEIYWRYGEHTPSRSRVMAEILSASSGYTVADPEGIASHGGFKDWFIEEFHRPGFTIEFGKGKNPLPLTDFETIYANAQEMLLLAALM